MLTIKELHELLVTCEDDELDEIRGEFIVQKNIALANRAPREYIQAINMATEAIDEEKIKRIRNWWALEKLHETDY